MPGQYDVRLKLLHPASQLHVAEMPRAAPTRRRAGRRGMMRQHPALRPACVDGFELACDLRPHERAVPPWAHREERVSDDLAVSVTGDAKPAEIVDPARDLL